MGSTLIPTSLKYLSTDVGISIELMHGSKQVLALQGLDCLAALLYSHNVAKVVHTLLGHSAVLTSSAMSAWKPKMTVTTSLWGSSVGSQAFVGLQTVIDSLSMRMLALHTT